MDVQRMEVLNAPTSEDSHGSHFPRDKATHDHSDSRIPAPKSRRATGESVSRPRAYSRSAGSVIVDSGPTTPRPIPKSKTTGKSSNHQSGASSSSYSYTFDEKVVDPFKPSTPSSFIPSMEPTFLKKTATATGEGNDNNNINTNTKSTGKPGSAPRSVTKGFDPKPAVRATTATMTSKETTQSRSPSPPAAKPISGASSTGFHVARSRDASISSLPRPNHDDMILPAVARRLKEQGGLLDHDVIAYSDDYDAPLYKLPGSPQAKGNPFASYDRARAASTNDLHGSPSSWNSQNPGPPPLPITATTTFNNQSPAETENKTAATNAAMLQQQQSNTSFYESIARAPSPESPLVKATPPERPQRARRNTQPEKMSPRSTQEYDRHGNRKPTRDENLAYSQMANQQPGQQYQQERTRQIGPRQSPRQDAGHGFNVGEDSGHYQEQNQQRFQNNNQYQTHQDNQFQGSAYGAQSNDFYNSREIQQQQQQQPYGHGQQHNYYPQQGGFARNDDRVPWDASRSPRDQIYPGQHQYQQQQQRHQRVDTTTTTTASTTIEMSEVNSPIKDEQQHVEAIKADVPKKKGTVCCVIM